jgi:hypothetical protein
MNCPYLFFGEIYATDLRAIELVLRSMLLI